MGRSIVIRVIIVAVLIIAYIAAVAMGVPDSYTGPTIIVSIALVLFFPINRRDHTQGGSQKPHTDVVEP
ncbi:hypothetical protein [Corynebacterium cystitidis]|uniref:Uncharacterized protein n=1 Tax=Corynebacterium cystitidis DSM 20524 TaxID=1121357 RepID=A0A1H9NN33_9CORY|nr:hypothetical protein [Corynebacterium cystitidis]WJY82797.1 hypothetical protein CCYS_09415 [Corynebacterium cystitidis DSM 20524]SER37444.1 hypothetical protein SAMN05661109_00033 [Corynebacterium cystitidis DSM 20524]SNV70395.1 Uncharacterised protein [Corynebacterium cystitidis]